MPWTPHVLCLPLVTPLHVGHHKIGNVDCTRHYAPAKLLWAAITARLTRDAQTNAAPDYISVGQAVGEWLRFSYFFPAVDPAKPLYPRLTDNGFRYGQPSDEITPEEFAWRFLGTYGSTALDYTANSAEEGTLHEAEFISPKSRDNGQQVYLVGVVFEREGTNCPLPWREVLARLQLGGEGRYGWGRFGDPQWVTPQATPFLGHFAPDRTAWPPAWALQPGDVVLAHTDTTVVKARGEVEALVGREWDNKSNTGAGRHLSQARICWPPGAIAQGEANITIDRFGVWEKA